MWQASTRVGLALLLAAGVAVGAAGAATPGTKPDAMHPVSAPAPAEAEAETVKQTEAEAVAAAKATGQAVEVGAFRGEDREVWANPDGTFTERRFQQPVRTVQAGRWVSVDPTLVRHPDGSVGPKAALVGLRLSGGGDGPLATVERAGRRLSVTWLGRLPQPALDGSTATYAEVLPGVDLVVEATAIGFSHVLVVKTAEAAKRPEVTDVTLGLQTTNLSVTGGGQAGLRAVDPATGGAVFEAAAPVMWDSSGSAAASGRAGAGEESSAQGPPEAARVAPVAVRVDGGRLHLTPDKAMLGDPGVRLPIYIDPKWEGTGVANWAMVDSGYPNEEYWRWDNGKDGRRGQRVGACPPSGDPCNASTVKRLFYVMPTPYQDDRISILGAELRVTMVHTYDAAPRDVAAYWMQAPIGPATNWNNQPDGPSWHSAVHQSTARPAHSQGSCTLTNQNVGFDVVGAVRDAAVKNRGDTTFGLRAVNEADFRHAKRFCNNAVLSVRYNRAPSKPARKSLTTSPGGACKSGSGRAFASVPPKLHATLKDPDGDQVKAQFVVQWTPPGGTERSKSWTSPMKNSGLTFTYNLAAALPNLPENTVIFWKVRASDGTGWGKWSNDGAAMRCEFIVDRTRPAGPDVDSREYLPADSEEHTPECPVDDTWHTGVGRYSWFTFDTAATDVVEYHVGFDDDDPVPADPPLTPDEPGGPAKVPWVPDKDGPHRVSVRTVDRAGNTSDTVTCHFLVGAGTIAGKWSMADPAGSTAARDSADAQRPHPAAAGAGVAFGQPGPGQPDRAVRLTGAADSYLATDTAGLVDTSGAFSVAAWVRLTDDTRDRVAVSQDGTGEPGFTLGFEAKTKRWAFAIPFSDVDSPGAWTVHGPLAVKGTWTHLVGVYDPITRKITLYVNGKPQPVAERRSVWASRGPVQTGRRLAEGGHTDHWIGDLADVAVYNRIVPTAEAALLGQDKPERRRYWPLNTATTAGGVPVSPERGGGASKALTLGGGAQVQTPDPLGNQPPLVGTGHLVLDGSDDHATAGPVEHVDGSFSVTARVRLASACNKTMTVAAEPGRHTSAFMLRCTVVDGRPRWELAMPHSDAAGNPPTTVVFTDDQPPSTGAAGQHLAIVYDEIANEMRLYVDGQLAQEEHPGAWRAPSGGLQIGRAKTNGAWTDHFAGVVDDVRFYKGTLDQTIVQQLARPVEQPDL